MITREQITAAIHETILAFKVHPYDINCGLCEEFAYAVIRRLTGEETAGLHTNGIEDIPGTPAIWASHVIVQWNNKGAPIYFDAECPEGVADLRRLPLVANRYKTRAEVVSENSFVFPLDNRPGACILVLSGK